MTIGKNVGLKKPDKLGRLALTQKILKEIGYNPDADFFQVEIVDGDTLVLHKLTLRAKTVG